MVETIHVTQMAYFPRPEHEIRARLASIIGHDVLKQIPLGMSCESLTKMLLDGFYEFKDVRTPTGEKDVVYSKNLQEMRHQMKEELRKELDEEVQKEFKRAASLDVLIHKANETEKALRDALKDQEAVSKALEKQLEAQREKLEAEKKDMEVDLNEARNRVSMLDEAIRVYNVNLFAKMQDFVRSIHSHTAVAPLFGSRELIRRLHLKSVEMLVEVKKDGTENQ
jgi:hypothetical protein